MSYLLLFVRGNSSTVDSERLLAAGVLAAGDSVHLQPSIPHLGLNLSFNVHGEL